VRFELLIYVIGSNQLGLRQIKFAVST